MAAPATTDDALFENNHSHWIFDITIRSCGSHSAMLLLFSVVVVVVHMATEGIDSYVCSDDADGKWSVFSFSIFAR